MEVEEMNKGNLTAILLIFILAINFIPLSCTSSPSSSLDIEEKRDISMRMLKSSFDASLDMWLECDLLATTHENLWLSYEDSPSLQGHYEYNREQWKHYRDLSRKAKAEVWETKIKLNILEHKVRNWEMIAESPGLSLEELGLYD